MRSSTHKPHSQAATGRSRATSEGVAIHNEDIANIFEEIADIVELENGNVFRIRAYRDAARTLRSLSEDVSSWLARGRSLQDLPGIGEDLAQQIEGILKTHGSKKLDQLRREIPPLALELRKTPGIGPKKAMRLCAELKPRPKTLADVLEACQKGKVRELPGFGPKFEASLTAALLARQAPARFKLADAEIYARALLERLRQAPGVAHVEIAGSYRRRRDTVGDLDILVASLQPQKATDQFLSAPEAQQTLESGRTKSAILLRNGMRVDLRVVDPKSYGAALVYFTGSKAHNIALRRRAQERGYKINEYGVFEETRMIAGLTEASVYKSLDLPFIAPELREDRGEIDAAAARHLPDLVTLGDIKGDLHVHTKASDGTASIMEMVDAARARHLTYIAITDHSQHMKITHGLSADRLAAQIDEIDKINAGLRDFVVLKGIEVDILKDGSLDLPNSILKRLDLVAAAVHSDFNLSVEDQTNRILRAFDNPYLTILAHPTGRLLLRREPYGVDMRRLMEAARQRGCFLEINAHPDRLDLNDVHCRMARELGLMTSIATDAHHPEDLSFMAYGVAQARRGWLEAGNILNAKSLRDLRPLLNRSHVQS